MFSAAYKIIFIFMWSGNRNKKIFILKHLTKTLQRPFDNINTSLPWLFSFKKGSQFTSRRNPLQEIF